MKRIQGCFQFFYSSKEEELVYDDVPTRDVTNTWNAGNKTEPHFERMMENWCPCRPQAVTANVKRALIPDVDHYMILTTRHPTKRCELAVGFLRFSRSSYGKTIKQFPKRWDSDKYLPYVGSKDAVLVGFEDAFCLRPWMDANRKHMPGKRCGIVYADAHPRLLTDILQHLRRAPNRIAQFLVNVKKLEQSLKMRSLEDWKNYDKRKRGLSYNSCSCSSKQIRKAQC